MKLKINKKQMVFLSLALVLCVAVYLNWRFLDNVDLEGGALSVGQTAEGEKQEEKILGQAQLVETEAKDVAAYFNESRVSKQQTRDEALELLKTVANSADAAAETKEKASNDMISLARTTDTESTVEGLIKAKGFSDCMVYISDASVNVVVATEGLSSEEAAQINEIVISETGKDASAVKIVEIKTKQ